MTSPRLVLSFSCSALIAIAAAACSDSLAGPNGPATGGGDAAVSGAPAGGAATGGASAGGSAGAVTGVAGGTLGGSATGGAGLGGAAGAASGGSSAGAGMGGTGGGGGGAGGASSNESVFHIFMLMGQFNMAGVAMSEPSDMNTDQRLKVWGGCNQPAGQWNLANPPLSDCPGGSGINLSTSVDPGIWFAKTLLKKLPAGHTVGLIGTAESGEKIETFITGGKHHAAIMKKIADVKTAANARFAGVIFHQGESNNTQGSWPGLVVQLYEEVKEAFGVDYEVPFILGELPAGGCCSAHNPRVHEAAMQLPLGAYVSQEGTDVMDQYHFDHDSVVLMGTRYGDKMIEMLNW